MKKCKYCKKEIETDNIVWNPDAFGDGYHLSCLFMKEIEFDLRKLMKDAQKVGALETMRAEIESIELLAEYTRGDIKRKALEIIDKYMSESEETDDYYKGAQEEY